MANTPVQPDPEKAQVGLTISPAKTDPPHHQRNNHHYTSRARERLRHFLHPDGRRIHIASSPDDAHTLRKRLEHLQQQQSQQRQTPSGSSSHSEPFDIFISGTPEHLEALRAAQTHHEDRREALREVHSTLFDQFSEIHLELDALARELDRVTTHGVSLSAHFSRFGYNAHVRSYDEDEETGGGSSPPSHSGSTTPRNSVSDPTRSSASSSSSSSSSFSSSDEKVSKGFATTLKLFKPPILRQYFHKGILWRASGSEEVQSFELFVDLLYVGIIAINGDFASENPTGLSLLRFMLTFTLSFKIWNDMALMISWFETDDIFQRVSILFLLACLFGYTTNITQAFEITYPTLIGFYLAARLYMAAYLFFVGFFMPTIRGVLGYYIFVSLVGASLWIASCHVPYPANLALIFTAMYVDVIGQIGHVFVIMGAKRLGKTVERFVDKWFEFTPAINIEHRTERMNAFVTLVFGYTVVAILYQSTVNGIDAFFGKGILGLIQAFVFNWLYFEIDSSNLHQHAIRRARASAMLWSLAHLPFISAFVLAGGALSRLVVTADTPGAEIEHLTEQYQVRSAEHVAQGVRWFYCAGLGVALACMAAISISHVHKEREGQRWPKKHRLFVRFSVAIILICLPLATHLDSLQLVGTVTGLVVLVLVVELWATSCCHEKLVGRSKECKYFGKCGKRRLEAMMRDGSEVDVDNLELDKHKHAGLASGP